jgi:cytochrome c556
MIKGETPFSPAVAKAALQNYNSVGYAFGDYFPAGSDKGDTSASPRIWEEMAAFQAEIARFRDDAQAALDSEPATLEAFQAAMGTMGRHCQTCHENYRIKRN